MKRFILLFLVALLSSGLYADDKTFRTEIDNAVELINSRLSHSRIVRVDDKGVVHIQAPDQMIEFPIQEVSFNYNDSDHRVRVAGDYNIRYYDEDGECEEVSHRQSFTCRSRRMAEDAIDAFRRIKDLFTTGSISREKTDLILPVEDDSLGYRTLKQAVRFVNDNLLLSLILEVNDNGIMSINAPSAMYLVDMKQAQFALNDWSDQPKVRIYGDWCVEMYEDDNPRHRHFVPRESFSSRSASRARQCVRALYYIKGALLGQTAVQIEDESNIKGTFREEYSNVEEAVDYINNRLKISIITGIDSDGKLVVNASENIYKIPLRSCMIRSGRNRISFFGIGLFGDRSDTVEIRCRKGLELYADRELIRRLDEENFSVANRRSVSEVVEAFEYLQNKIR